MSDPSTSFSTDASNTARPWGLWSATSLVVGSMIGMLLPFILSRFRMDPATASTPLVTSIADATGVLIYFSIAKAVLSLP